MRIPHWLKENKRDRVYKRYLFVDTETEGYQVDDVITKHVFKIACSLYIEFRTQDDILRDIYSEEEKVFFSSSEFFNYLDSKLRCGSTLVVVAHNWRFDFVALNAYDELIRRGFECRHFICESTVFYASFVRGTHRVIFLDSTNIFKVPLAELGKVVNIHKMSIPEPEEGVEKLIEYCRNDVRILARAFMLYVRFLRENNLGDMKLTIAAQSFAAFRHRFMGNAIYIHNSDMALNLEREAYFGGRNECFHIGRIDKTVYKLDVNSMYPYVMKTYEYPYKFVAFLKDIDVGYLRKLLGEYCVIAHVLLSSPENAFPKRLNGKLIFPVGTFDTFLCTPELIYAIERNYVKKVYSAAVYKKARIFREYVEFFYRKRMEYKEQGNSAFAAIAKLFLNSLYGKFGQRGERWVEVGEDKSGTAFSEWYEIDTVTGEKRRMRSMFGKVYKHVKESESFNSFPAIAAHVTSYARMRLWEIIIKAGVKNVYYCDTDSVFVNEEGYRNLCRYQEVDDKELGKLKLEGAYRWMILRGCKDYALEGDEEKIKGVRKNAEKISENTYVQEQFRNPIQCYKAGFFDSPIVEKRTKVLQRKYDKGVVTSFGVVVPFRLSPPPLRFLCALLRLLSLSR